MRSSLQFRSRQKRTDLHLDVGAVHLSFHITPSRALRAMFRSWCVAARAELQ